MADLATLGFKVDSSGLVSGEKALDKMTGAGKKAETQTKKLDTAQEKSTKTSKQHAKATDEAAKATAQMGRKVGMASVQVEQLIGSISGGQNPLKAFAFQAADLGIVLGAPLVGAIVGVSASLASMFLPAVLDSLMGTKSFSADIENLKENLDDLAKLGRQRLAAVQAAATEESNKKLKESITLNGKLKELEAERLRLANLSKASFLPSKSRGPTPLAGAGIGEEYLIPAKLIEVNKKILETKSTLEDVNAELVKQNDLAFTAGDQLKNIVETGKTISEDDKKALEDKNKKLIAQNELINRVAASIQGQVIALRDGSKAAAEFAIRQQLGLKATDALPIAIKKQIDALNKLNKTTKEAPDTFNETASAIANIGSAWQGTAGETISAIGKMMGAADQYQSKMDQVAKSGGGMGGLLPTIGLAVTAFSVAQSLFGGGGGSTGMTLAESQKLQSVGTLQGFDDKASTSIITSFDHFADIQEDQLAELVDLNRSFYGLSLALAGAGGASVGALIPKDEEISFGNLVGGVFTSGISIAEQTYSELQDGINASISKVVQTGTIAQYGAVDISEEPELENRLTDIFSGISSAVIDSAELLASGDFAEKINNTLIGAFDISLLGMDADERQEALSEAFSAQADKLAKTAFSEDFFQQWQKDGEGAFETLNRLATEQASYNDSIQMIGSSLDDAFSIDQAQNVLAYAGGFGEFSSMAKDFFNDFLTTTEQLEFQGNKLNDTLTELGFDNLPMNNDAFKELVNSIDRTTDEGQKLYVELLQLAPAFADFTDKTKMLNNERLMLEADLLDAQGRAVDALAIRRNMELEAMDSSLHALQQQVWAEQDRADAMAKSTAQAKAQEAERKRAIEETNSMLNGVISNIRGGLGINKASLSDALSGAKAGNFAKAQNLDVNSLINLSESAFSSLQSMQLQEAINRNQLTEIANLAEGRLTDTEKQTNLLGEINDGISDLVEASHPSTTGGFVGNSSAKSDENEEIKEMLEKIMNASASTAKWTSQTASNTQKICYDGITVEVE